MSGFVRYIRESVLPFRNFPAVGLQTWPNLARRARHSARNDQSPSSRGQGHQWTEPKDHPLDVIYAKQPSPTRKTLGQMTLSSTGPGMNEVEGQRIRGRQPNKSRPSNNNPTSSSKSQNPSSRPYSNRKKPNYSVPGSLRRPLIKPVRGDGECKPGGPTSRRGPRRYELMNMVGGTQGESNLMALRNTSEFNAIEDFSMSNLAGKPHQGDEFPSTSDTIVTNNTSNGMWLDESYFGISVYPQKSVSAALFPANVSSLPGHNVVDCSSNLYPRHAATHATLL